MAADHVCEIENINTEQRRWMELCKESWQNVLWYFKFNVSCKMKNFKILIPIKFIFHWKCNVISILFMLLPFQLHSVLKEITDNSLFHQSEACKFMQIMQIVESRIRINRPLTYCCVTQVHAVKLLFLSIRKIMLYK